MCVLCVVCLFLFNIILFLIFLSKKLHPRYLLDSGAFPVPVNNDGQTPCDLGEEYEDIVDMIEKEIQNQGK